MSAVQMPGYNGQFVLDGDRLRFEYYTAEQERQKREAALHRAVKATDFEALNALRKKHPTAQRIVEAVCDRCSVSTESVMGRGRTQAVAQARHIAMWLLRSLRLWSLTSISRTFGRDHSSTAWACKKVAAMLQTDPDLGAIVCDVIDSLLEEN